MPSLRSITRSPIVRALAAAALALFVAAFLYMEPWHLFTNSTVNEPSPSSAGKAAEPIARGGLISHEHHTTGTASLLRLPNGRTVLRLEDLKTSEGPDVHVWLTNAPVIKGHAGWGIFDDGKHVDLGPLKANRGNQNYLIPSGTSLADLTSVSLWCDRFNVSFGAATLKQP